MNGADDTNVTFARVCSASPIIDAASAAELTTSTNFGCGKKGVFLFNTQGMSLIINIMLL